MRTIPDMMRTDEFYPAACDSIPQHCQDSELPTGEHISASIESASTVLVPHASLSGRNAGCSRTGRSPAADGSGPTSLGPHVQWARPQRPPRASGECQIRVTALTRKPIASYPRARNGLRAVPPSRARVRQTAEDGGVSVSRALNALLNPGGEPRF